MSEKQLSKHTELLQLMHIKQILTLQTTDSSYRSYYILFVSYSGSLSKFSHIHFSLSLSIVLVSYYSLTFALDLFLHFLIISCPLILIPVLPFLFCFHFSSPCWCHFLWYDPGSLNPHSPSCALVFLFLPWLSASWVYPVTFPSPRRALTVYQGVGSANVEVRSSGILLASRRGLSLQLAQAAVLPLQPGQHPGSVA